MTSTPTPVIWEYRVLENPAPDQFTILGRQGWELVAVTCIVSGFARSERAYFKRPLVMNPARPAGT